ncbi:MAG TPA: TRAM domain-containing protein [Acidimicrobiales bacterium]|nr:TRAM domain-containing protein [Acidimicrobiales bacterium]
MFVEITRLFIVFLATAAGFALGRGSGVEPGNGAVVGATLGACIGYVAGGGVGRLLRRAMGSVEAQVERTPASRLLAGTVGALAAGMVTALLGVPAVMLLPGRWGWPVLGMLVWIGVYYGYVVAGRKTEELLALAGLSTRPLVRTTPYGDGAESSAVLLDTSSIMDGRLLPLARSGFLRDALLVPRFVLDELQGIADAQDPIRRRKGRSGLELLDVLRTETSVRLHITDDELPEHPEVDTKLIVLAKRLGVSIVTTDSALQKVAELQGVQCMNLHRLVDGLRPQFLPGETVRIQLEREGKEPGQGVGFLDDGTMVVVTGGGARLGQELDVRITGGTETSVGRMLFAAVNDE